MANIATLHAAVAAVCPILGVSVGNWADKTTWRVDYAAAATVQQQTAAAGVVTAFDPNASTNNPVILPFSEMLSRLTDAEYTGIMAAVAAQITAGNAAVPRWIDNAKALGINLNDPNTATVQNKLVTANLLTSARVPVVFAAP